MKRFGDELLTKDEGKEKHLPSIEAPKMVKTGESFEVKIWAGNEPHPSTMEHHIKWIQVFLKPENRPMLHILTFEPGPTMVEPRLSFYLSLDRPAVLYAISYCTIHGVWENNTEIEVI